MDVGRGDLIGDLADPLGHQPEPPGGADPVPAHRIDGGRGLRPARISANAETVAGLAIVAAVAGTGILAGQGLADRRAVLVTVFPLALSVIAAVLLVGYGRRLGRFAGHEGELAGALSRLSDRDELAGRLRSASEVLSDVAAELRTGARYIKEVTRQQSTVATDALTAAQEFADTAGSLSQTMHTAAEAAERTGDAMSFLRSQIDGVARQDETSATIVAAEQGIRQAREVGTLMTSTTAMLEDSIIVSRQQKLAADEIDAAIRRVRDEHGSLTATMTGQRMWLIDRIEALAADMDIDRAVPATGSAGPDAPG